VFCRRRQESAFDFSLLNLNEFDLVSHRAYNTMTTTAQGSLAKNLLPYLLDEVIIHYSNLFS